MTTSDLQSFREQFFQLVEKAHCIAITSHISPDDDSIGSVLSMYTFLTEKYPEKEIHIFYTGKRVERYHVFHNFEKIEWIDDVGNHLEGVDMLIMLDASQYPRFSSIPEKLKGVPATVVIDHHASTPEQFSLLLYKPEYSSNTQLLYHALIEGGEYSKEIGEHILLGLVGDTGNFAYVGPGQTRAFLLGKELVEKVGISIDAFRSRYMGIPRRIIPLLQELVKNTSYKEVDNWPPLQYTFIERDIFSADGYDNEDMSAASHIYLGQYLPRVEGYQWGFVVTPRSDGGCRMSGRSLPGSVNVRTMFEQVGIGSGHDRAAGASFKEADPKECVAYLLDWMKTNKPVLG